MKFHEIFPDFYKDNEPWYEFIKEILSPEFDVALEEVKALWNLIDIDTISEDKLPLLASNLGFDFVEILPASYRKQLANAIDLHKFKGTRFAVEKALDSLGIKGNFKEWFEYGGEPYKFKIDLFFENLLKLGITLSPEVQEKLIRLINEYKNERSWLDELKFHVFFKNKQKIATNSKLSTFTKASLEEDTEKKILMSQDGEYRVFGTGIEPVSFTKTTLEEETEKRLSLENGVSIFSTAKATEVSKASLESTETQWSFSSSCAVSGSFNSLAFLRINLTGGIN
ncbi:phage tail protein, P2 protein I family [Balnearium lithotrophicum]|uniref:Phage tail protein, P2 protein I family n=1 Tax=Balnearium lithotrophicum TaxID=223788 RepID=A0A521CHZ6_9BACT|nr:phage tail protein [Balnearium lithotrophicum]SMO59022.1 phage tail protein, P2 protein I family [Balnearium lithotrophicum]